MRRAPAIAVIVAAAALVGLLTYGIASSGTDTTIDSALARGERLRAPDMALPLLDSDATGSIADFRGKVVVLNFWASWCEPCKQELPLLQKTQRNLEGRNATLLGVDLEEPERDAMKWVRRYGLTYPSLRDLDRKLARDYGTTSYPETFVIDRDGRIAARQRGPVDQAWLDATLPKILAEKG